MAHLLGAEAVHIEFPTRVVFDSVTLGVAEGDLCCKSSSSLQQAEHSSAGAPPDHSFAGVSSINIEPM